MTATNPESSVLSEREGAILTLTLNRPEKSNTLHPSLVKELSAAVNTKSRAAGTVGACVAGHPREADQGKAALEECMKELAGRQQEILTLRYKHEKTVQQIAELCQRPKSTIHDLLGKIRYQLLRCVQRRLST